MANQKPNFSNLGGLGSAAGRAVKQSNGQGNADAWAAQRLSYPSGGGGKKESEPPPPVCDPPLIDTNEPFYLLAPEDTPAEGIRIKFATDMDTTVVPDASQWRTRWNNEVFSMTGKVMWIDNRTLEISGATNEGLQFADNRLFFLAAGNVRRNCGTEMTAPQSWLVPEPV